MEEQISVSLEFLKNGGAPDYAAYRETVGHLRGLKDALALLDDIEQENE